MDGSVIVGPFWASLATFGRLRFDSDHVTSCLLPYLGISVGKKTQRTVNVFARIFGPKFAQTKCWKDIIPRTSSRWTSKCEFHRELCEFDPESIQCVRSCMCVVTQDGPCGIHTASCQISSCLGHFQFQICLDFL